MTEVTGPRSAIVVPIAIPIAIERMRHARVPVARLGVPAHVTIVSPFAPPARLDDAIRATLGSIAATAPAFDVRLERIERFPGVLWLDPQPSMPFRRLIEAVVGAFPEWPPYGEPSYRAEDQLPHLTIALADADRGGEAALDALEAEVRPWLPASDRASAMDLLVEGADGHWRRRWRFPLRP